MATVSSRRFIQTFRTVDLRKQADTKFRFSQGLREVWNCNMRTLITFVDESCGWQCSLFFEHSTVLIVVPTPVKAGLTHQLVQPAAAVGAIARLLLKPNSEIRNAKSKESLILQHKIPCREETLSEIRWRPYGLKIPCFVPAGFGSLRTMHYK